MFWDNVEISVKAGDGGDGLISFRRERGEARGGPDGGDGGRGGDVTLETDPQLNMLQVFARQKQFTAQSGKPGGKGKRHGKSADTMVLRVPVGTAVYEREKLVADLTKNEQRVVIAKGGRGGFGNAHFTSSVRQTPRQAELGEPGVVKTLRLELKLVADVGLVGLPSVGKSTLLARLTAAKPKIADYPFTTTIPQLGVAKVDRDHSIVLADIPGLIAGAHRGKGLGDAFLRHVERTKVIIHLLDATRPDPVADYQQLHHELRLFDEQLIHKPELVVLNKADTLDSTRRGLLAEDVSHRLGRPVAFISAVSGEGIAQLLRQAATLVKRRGSARDTSDPSAVPTFTLADLAPLAVSAKKVGGKFELRGAKIEQLAKQTDFGNPEATERFWWVLRRLGAAKQLEKLGAGRGSVLTVAGISLKWPGL